MVDQGLTTCRGWIVRHAATLPLVVSVASFGSAAQAASTLDQSYLIDTSGSYSSIGIGNTYPGVQYDGLQTVTAGLTGKLTGLNLELFNDTSVGAVEISIISNIAIDPVTKTISGNPSGILSLAGSALPTTAQSRDGALVSLDTSSLNLFVSSGEAFGIRVSFVQPPQTFGIAWAESFQSVSTGYTGGEGYFAVGNQESGDVGDLGFQSYVDPSQQPSVPEPASWAMMLGGFGMIGGAMRGRRKPAVSFS